MDTEQGEESVGHGAGGGGSMDTEQEEGSMDMEQGEESVDMEQGREGRTQSRGRETVGHGAGREHDTEQGGERGLGAEVRGGPSAAREGSNAFRSPVPRSTGPRCGPV